MGRVGLLNLMSVHYRPIYIADDSGGLFCYFFLTSSYISSRYRHYFIKQVRKCWNFNREERNFSLVLYCISTVKSEILKLFLFLFLLLSTKNIFAIFSIETNEFWFIALYVCNLITSTHDYYEIFFFILLGCCYIVNFYLEIYSIRSVFM